MALRAKFEFETDVFFMILLRKIMKNTSVSKEYSAAAGGETLFMVFRAKLSIERHLIVEISLREISTMRCLSK